METDYLESKTVSPGQRIGRWTVLDGFIKTTKGENKWLCRCDCGTERYVLERSLRFGGSLSCGCLRKEAAAQAIAHDLTGQTFGELTVIGIAECQPKNGGRWWHCRCECGEECDFPATLLVTGRRTHCSGQKHEKNYYYSNIAGQRFGRLVVEYRVKTVTETGSVLWHCKCDCGNETDILYNSLMYGNQTSCGCKRKEHDQILNSLQTHVDGTSLDIIQSQKLPTDNTTGYKGVYLIKGKYVAKLVFQKKAYYLGSYDKIEDAAQARKEGENILYDATVEYYTRWKSKAALDPEWAEQNPVQIRVTKTNGQLCVNFLPTLDM